MAMTEQLLSSFLWVGRRYMRSVDIGRDLTDPKALDGYVITPSVRDGIRRITEGLAKESTQRAFRVTGPYGSGKSAFGLAIARLLRDGPKGGGSTDSLRAAGLRTDQLEVPAYVPLVLTGKRASFSDALVEAVLRGSKGEGLGVRATRIAQAASALIKRRGAGERNTTAVLELIAEYAKHLGQTKDQGLLILIDEMGRYLENAAANQQSEDPSLFQQLAELAGGSGPRVAVIGFLHHRFADYAAGLGEWVEAEWARSAERYEDIPFQESIEQVLHLLAQALQHDPAAPGACVVASKKLYGEAAKARLFLTPSAEIETLAPKLFPLHPAVISCLAHVARRFGQNERSIFGFLQSLEPFGFQRFIREHTYSPDNWYRLPDLFDYLVNQDAMRLRSSDRERRWTLALEAAGHGNELSKVERDVLKVVALVSVVDGMRDLVADPATIAWCIGIPETDIQPALATLRARNLVYKRPRRSNYTLWSSASVDLDQWLEEAKIHVPTVRRLGQDAATLTAGRPLVAHRHYHHTGTMRTFAVSLASDDLDDKVAAQGHDGAIVVRPIHPDEDEAAIHDAVLAESIKSGQLHLYCLRRVSPADLGTAHDLALWRWIAEKCEELRIDQVARAEVQARIAAAQAELSASLVSLGRAGARSQEIWIHNGQIVDVPHQRALNLRLSEICDAAFHAAPILRNELINRSKLSAAIASARMRLLELMVTDAGYEYLKLSGAPPERTIYLSLFHASGMHREVTPGRFQFGPPPDEDKLNWKPVWAKIEALLSEGAPRSFAELAIELGKAPVGLRTGPALLVLAAFMLHNRGAVALLERNSFLSDVTGAHFMRLAKNPENFSLRYFGSAEDRIALLRKLATGLKVWRPDRPTEPTVKAVADELYTWWINQPDYSVETYRLLGQTQAVRTVLKRAVEPVSLILEQLPGALGLPDYQPIDPNEYVERLNNALDEIDGALPAVRRQAEAVILDAFACRSVAEVRSTIEADYKPHRSSITEYRLGAFVDRATATDLNDATWLDGIAGLIVGRRLDSWKDTTIDEFDYEIRAIASRLNRWLTLTRKSLETVTPLISVHVTAINGNEHTNIVHSGRVPPSVAEKVAEVQSLLSGNPNAALVLSQVLADQLSAQLQKATL